jgi:hypothetical protein
VGGGSRSGENVTVVVSQCDGGIGSVTVDGMNCTLLSTSSGSGNEASAVCSLATAINASGYSQASPPEA